MDKMYRKNKRYSWLAFLALCLLMSMWSIPAQAQSRPDLSIRLVSISDASPQQNQLVSVSYQLQNRTSRSASNVAVRFYYSTDKTITAGDQYLGVQRTFGFIPGNRTLPSLTRSYGITLRIPIDAPTGTGYIGAIIDYNNTIRESNENNNTSSLVVNVNANNTTRDLRISYVKLSKSDPSPGDQVTVEYRIYNAGGAAIAIPFSTQIYLSTNNRISVGDINLGGSRTVPRIGARTVLPSSTTTFKVTVTIPSTIQTGNYFISPLVDYSNQIPEIDNTNNYLATPIRIVSRQPDLTVDLVSVSSTTPSQGQSVTLRYRVRNSGQSDAVNAKVRFYLSTNSNITTFDTYLNVERTHSIKAGQTLPGSSTTYSVTVTVPVNYSTGVRYFGAIIDYNRRIPEGNENNNQDNIRVFVRFSRSTRDLTVFGLSVAPNRAENNEQITVNFRIFNAGRASITTPFKTQVYISTDSVITTADQPIGGVLTFSRLNARTATQVNSVSVRVPSNLKPGNYFIGVFVDYEKRITENIETNNYASTQLTVFNNTPDLQVNITSASPSTVNPGQSVTIRYRFYNAGGSNAGPFTVRFYFSNDSGISTNDTYLNVERTFQALPANGFLPSSSGTYSATIRIPSGAPGGVRYLGAFVDYNNKVKESVETNNTDAQPINVRRVRTVDLVVPFVTANVKSVNPGGSVTFEYRVRNNGNTDSGPSLTQFYRSSDSVVTSADLALGNIQRTPSVKAGQTLPSATTSYRVTVTIPANTPAGTYWIGPVADYNNTVAETNNNNNGAGVEITVIRTTPKTTDLEATSLSASPSSQFAGQNTIITFVITNKGTTTIVNELANVYFSRDRTFDRSDRAILTLPVRNLSPGQAKTYRVLVRIPNISPNRGFLLGVVDPLNTLKETNENNNVTVIPFTVLRPNVEPPKEPRPEPPRDTGVEPPRDGGTRPEPRPEPPRDTGAEPPRDGGTRPEPRPEKPSDQGRPDQGPTDQGRPDQGRPDQGRPDQGRPDQGRPDQGPSDQGRPDQPDCYKSGCPSGEICQNGKCVSDPCQGISCPSGEVCKEGSCREVCGCKECPLNEKCEDGQCVADPCQSNRCPKDEVCDPNTGQCEPDRCSSVKCPVGRVCSQGQCVDDPCNNIKCPTKTVCRAGQCVGQNCTNPGQEGTTEATPDSGQVESSNPDNGNSLEASSDSDMSSDGDNTDSAGSGDKSGGDSGIDPSNQPGTIAGGCCQVSRLSNQGASVVFAFMILLVLLSFRRKERFER